MKRYIHKTKLNKQERKAIEPLIKFYCEMAHKYAADNVVYPSEKTKTKSLKYLTKSYTFIYQNLELFRYDNKRNGLDKYTLILNEIKEELENGRVH